MVPKLTLRPDAIDTLMPSTSGILSTGIFISRAQDAAAATAPTMPVVCQPPTSETLGLARTRRLATSHPIMKAAMHSAGVARKVSATGRIAGITADTD